MERQSRRTRTKANALTNPQPSRVSMCKAGANQTPFAGLKSESVTLSQKTELPNMITKLKAAGYEVLSFAFKGDNWNRAAVDGWLSSGGYVGVEVSGEDGSYVATSAEVPAWAEQAEKREIATDDGVTVTLMKAPEEAETAPVAEAGSEVQPVAPEAATKSPMEIAAEKMASATAALAALKGSMRVAANKSEERKKSLYTVTSLGSVIQDLKWIINDLTYDQFWSDDAEDAAEGEPTHATVIEGIKGAAQWLLYAFSVLVAVEVDDMADAFGLIAATADATEATKTAEPAPVEAPVEEPAATPAVEPEAAPAAEPEAPAEAAPAAEPETAPAAKSEDMPAWAQAFLVNVTKSVDALTGEVKAAVQKTDDLERRVKAEEENSSRQVRRSEADPELAAGIREARSKEEREATKSVEELRFRNGLGI